MWYFTCSRAESWNRYSTPKSNICCLMSTGYLHHDVTNYTFKFLPERITSTSTYHQANIHNNYNTGDNNNRYIMSTNQVHWKLYSFVALAKPSVHVQLGPPTPRLATGLCPATGIRPAGFALPPLATSPVRGAARAHPPRACWQVPLDEEGHRDVQDQQKEDNYHSAPGVGHPREHGGRLTENKTRGHQQKQNIQNFH